MSDRNDVHRMLSAEQHVRQLQFERDALRTRVAKIEAALRDIKNADVSPWVNQRIAAAMEQK